MLAFVGLSCLLPLPTLVTALVMGDDYSQLLLPVLLLAATATATATAAATAAGVWG